MKYSKRIGNGVPNLGTKVDLLLGVDNVAWFFPRKPENDDPNGSGGTAMAVPIYNAPRDYRPTRSSFYQFAA